MNIINQYARVCGLSANNSPVVAKLSSVCVNNVLVLNCFVLCCFYHCWATTVKWDTEIRSKK